MSKAYEFSGLPSNLADATPEMVRRLDRWEGLADNGLADEERLVADAIFDFLGLIDKENQRGNPEMQAIEERALCLRRRSIEAYTVRRVLAANASKGGDSKSAKLAHERAQVRALWNDWQSGKTRHRSGAAFHRFVVDNVPGVTSEKTVERWSRKWAEENSG